MTFKTILTAAEMRAAEAAAMTAGTPDTELMERAGIAAADAILAYAAWRPTLVLCGPGNNGGDGYVIARRLAERGAEVRVAALADPVTDAARRARSRWAGPVESLDAAEPASLLVDALFGTGLSRGLDEPVAQRLLQLARAARVRVAVDLPSGVATDDGSILSPVPDYDLTISFATLKPSHLLQPAARHMGRLVVADIGLDVESRVETVERPLLVAPGPADHKYSRGYVAVLAGEMPGAAALTASASLRCGAGYVRLVAPTAVEGVPRAVVQGGADAGAVLADPRVSAIAIGPGLGRGEEGRALLDRVLGAQAKLVLDADALTLAAEAGADFLHRARMTPVLTPHAGEFNRLFADRSGSKVDQARRAAEQARAVIVFKGPDTVVAAPDGRVAIAVSAPHWLATAGTGDVLTGVIAAMRAWGLEAFEAACAGVWLHGRAAERAGPGLIADDLLDHLPGAFAECL
ncbi:NAD(P)H-hydrate dehydratase [Allosphingosinicella deserti]|uniref:Bifunctional NAD(P)H-hydrate repair enzyme n=1 Tax=Allosphingosinicella deserti TaxID=2116704 RepID=A0A2P7QN44_9SPHN|nr:NAD(P)H-hydrate dehydratase [Sphingomonas deserti]PSJ39380.1 bifunctional ADP-dependent NAD(P)H-hydrate dehydratase/NAD(P)H-hydrate epimerase [Sphingomonas deserti]